MNKNHIILLFRIILGAVFIFSGIAKLDSIYQFEQAIFKAGLSNWDIIPYFSRFIIAAEIFLGLCFFHKDGLKKFTIPATFLMLVIFTVHLGYTIVTEGGTSGNCGCFGEKFPMTPIQSLLKNIVMLGMLAYMFFVNTTKKSTQELAIPFSLAILSILLVVVFFPIKPYVTGNQNSNTSSIPITDSSKSETINELTIIDSTEKATLKTELSVKPANIKNQVNDKTKQGIVEPKKEELKEAAAKQNDVKLLPKATSYYAPFKTFSDGNTIDLDEGIKIVTMYNSGCDHCMDNAKKLCELSTRTKLPTWRILFWGNEGEIPAFFEHAKCNTPYMFLQPQVFFPLLGKGNFPKIILLNNGNVVGEWEGDDAVQKLEESLKKI